MPLLLKVEADDVREYENKDKVLDAGMYIVRVNSVKVKRNSKDTGDNLVVGYIVDDPSFPNHAGLGITQWIPTKGFGSGELGSLAKACGSTYNVGDEIDWELCVGKKVRLSVKPGKLDDGRVVNNVAGVFPVD